MSHHRMRLKHGFTLTELLVVIAIIGILMTFILIAAGDGVRRAEEKATLGLIAKLEMGLSERIEAILIRRADIYQSHIDISSIYTTNGKTITAPQRAQVLAQIDLFRAEVPDVFFYQKNDQHYPINFAGLPYPSTPVSIFVPLGAQPGDTTRPVLGAYGATWQAASGILKNLGYLPSGYDGVDNNGDGYIDNLIEGVGSNPTVADPDSPKNTISLSNLIARRLSNHTHNTARSEMLYALLVEGQGPLGSVFSADEFNKREVGDTDGDGLPEFIDAWGQPLQFYRWPIYYNGDYNVANGGPTGGSNSTTSYVQKGSLAYVNMSEVRQTDPLDPNQQLMAPSWFSTSNQPFGSFTSGPNYSAGAGAFMTYFHTLLDPNFGSVGVGQTWDRSGFYARRAFYSRPLILSGGPDKQPGVAMLPNSPTPTASQLIGFGIITLGENSAVQLPTLSVDGQDDITNQSLASPGGGSH